MVLPYGFDSRFPHQKITASFEAVIFLRENSHRPVFARACAQTGFAYAAKSASSSLVSGKRAYTRLPARYLFPRREALASLFVLVRGTPSTRVCTRLRVRGMQHSVLMRCAFGDDIQCSTLMICHSLGMDDIQRIRVDRKRHFPHGKCLFLFVFYHMRK